MANEQNLKPFVKGDPRINRKGRPKSFDALRELAKQIAREPLGESGLTTVEAILRKWASGKEGHIAQARFVEIAYGKVPDNVDITSGGEPLGPLVIVRREQDGN